MTTFGEYERGDAIYVGLLCSVYTARRVGAKGGRGRYVVKVCAAGGALVSGGDDARRDFRKQAGVQKAVSLRAPKRWSVIHDIGEVADGTYLITDRFDRAVQWIIDGRLRVESGDLLHLSRSVIRSLIDLRDECKRGHGNLKPSNILLTRPQVRRSRVVLADPAPDAPSTTRREEHDLFQLGTILYELVTGRSYRSLGDWPIEDGPAWSRMGSAGEKWRAICNDFLCPDQHEALTDLEEALNRLRKDFGAEKPTGFKAVVAAVVVLVLLSASAFGWWAMRPGFADVFADHQAEIQQLEESAPSELAGLLDRHENRLLQDASRASIGESERLLAALRTSITEAWNGDRIHRSCFVEEWEEKLNNDRTYDIESLTASIQADRFKAKPIMLPGQDPFLVCEACEENEYNTRVGPTRTAYENSLESLVGRLNAMAGGDRLRSILPIVDEAGAGVRWERLDDYNQAIAELTQFGEWLDRMDSQGTDWDCFLRRELSDNVGSEAIDQLVQLAGSVLDGYELQTVTLPGGEQLQTCNACAREKFDEKREEYRRAYEQYEQAIQRQVSGLSIEADLLSWLPGLPAETSSGDEPDWDSLQSLADVNTQMKEVSAWLVSIEGRELDWECIRSNELQGRIGDAALDRLVSLDGSEVNRFVVVPFDENEPAWSDVRDRKRAIEDSLKDVESKLQTDEHRRRKESLELQLETLSNAIADLQTCEACFERDTSNLLDSLTTLNETVDRFIASIDGVGTIGELRAAAIEAVNTRVSEVQAAARNANGLAEMTWLPQAIADQTDTDPISRSNTPDVMADQIEADLDEVLQSISELAASFNLNPDGAALPVDSWRVAHAGDFRSEQQSAISEAWNRQSASITSLDELASFIAARSSDLTERAATLDAIFAGANEVSDLLDRNMLPTPEVRATISTWDRESADEPSWLRDALRTTLDEARQFLDASDSRDEAFLWSIARSGAVPHATAWAAWEQLQTLNAVPDARTAPSLDDLIPLIDVRRTLEEHLDAEPSLAPDQRRGLESNLPDAGEILWDQYVRSRIFDSAGTLENWASNDQQRLNDALSKRQVFGVPTRDVDLSEEIQFNIVLAEMALERDEATIQQRLSDWATRLESLTDVNEARTLATELRTIIAAIENGGGGDGSGPIQLAPNQQVGPERVGWTRREDPANPGRLIFTRAGSNVEIAFRPVLTSNGMTTYLAETEASIGLCREALVGATRQGGALAALARDVSQRMLGDTTGAGPKGWVISGGVLGPAASADGKRGWLTGELEGLGSDIVDFDGEEQPYPRDSSVQPPSESTAMHVVSATEATSIALMLGCRIPTEEEWARAVELAGGSDQLSRIANLRDQAWQDQRDHLIGIEQNFDAARGGAPEDDDLRLFSFWPDGNAFVTPEANISRDADALVWRSDLSQGEQSPANPYRDGTVWFDDVDEQPGGAQPAIRHLVGNVAEFVLREEESLRRPLEDALESAEYPNRATSVASLIAPQGQSSVGVIGGSALSPPETPLDQFQTVDRNRVLSNRYADVGFRLAFRARTQQGPRVAILDRFSQTLTGRRFVTSGEDQ